MPMRAAMNGRPCCAHCSCIAFNLSRIASAERQAQRACSSSGRGAPQKAMMASPMYLSTVPRCSRTVSLMRSKYSPSAATSWAGSIASDKVVNPAMSEKSVVMTSFSPPSTASRPVFNRSCTSSRGTYFPKERRDDFMRSVAALIAFTSQMTVGSSDSLRSVSSKRPMRSISSEMSIIDLETRPASTTPKSAATRAPKEPMSTASNACCSASPK